ncbi:hypothetical protein M1D47_17075 [Bacillus sp. R1-10]
MCFTVFLNGWKKFATLLPSNWLAETPQALALRRLGRQSAEREGISGINWNVIFRNPAGWTHPEPSFRIGDPRLCFTVFLNGWKKFATLLPSNWLAETPQALALRRLSRQSAERGRISGINWNVIFRKPVGWTYPELILE